LHNSDKAREGPCRLEKDPGMTRRGEPGAAATMVAGFRG
jgi:hypothetical protein